MQTTLDKPVKPKRTAFDRAYDRLKSCESSVLSQWRFGMHSGYSHDQILANVNSETERIGRAKLPQWANTALHHYSMAVFDIFASWQFQEHRYLIEGFEDKGPLTCKEAYALGINDHTICHRALTSGSYWKAEFNYKGEIAPFSVSVFERAPEMFADKGEIIKREVSDNAN